MIESIQTKRIGHAYIFCGPDGIGRRTMAECFSRSLTCAEMGDRPCGRCESCVLNENGTNPDIIYIRRKENKATIGVDDVRLIQEEVLTAPRFGAYKVIVFENAEKMTVQAQNALLKTLEEPPEYIIMILISSNNSQILDTVKSRAVSVEFKRYSDSEILEAYKKQRKEEIDSRILCEYADGIIGRALSVADSNEYGDICNKITDNLKLLYEGGGRALCDFQNLFAEYSDKRELFFFILYSILRDISVAAGYRRSIPLQNVQVEDKIYRLSDCIGYHRATECLALVNKSWRMTGQNVNYKLMADALAIRIQEVIHD